MNKLALFARSASVYIKIIAALVGLVAAYLWYKSATAPDAQIASSFNAWAAIVTAIAVGGQGISSIIDWWIAPTATYA